MLKPKSPAIRGSVAHKGAVLTAIALVCGAPGLALGQETPRSPSSQLDVESLQQALQERDARINDLLRRVETLERQAGQAPPQIGAPQPTATPSPPPAPAEAEERVASALERSLVERGGLLLPPGSFEIQPQLQWQYSNEQELALSGDLIGFQDARDDRVDGSITGRVGLPYDFQVEATVPYVWRRIEADFPGDSNSTSSRGIGDIAFAATHQFVRERGRIPDILGFAAFRTKTGKADLTEDEVFLGDGAYGLTGGLTAVKSLDPLVFIGQAAYTYNFDGDDVEPGDQISLSGGTILAVSPRASLRAFLDLDFNDEAEIDGDEIRGSDQVAASIELGGSAVLTPRTLLTLGVAFGVTDDAPDLALTASLPIRF